MRLHIHSKSKILLKGISHIQYNLSLTEESLNRLNSIYKFFNEEKQPLINVEESIIKKRKTNFLQYFIDNKQQLIESDKKIFGELSNYKTREDILKWLLYNQTNFAIDDYFKLDRGDRLLNKMMYSNPFIPINVISYLENNDLIFRYCKYGNIELYCYEKEKILNFSEIIKICLILQKLTKRENRKITIVMGMTNFEKKIYENLETFIPIVINSGSSYRKKYINMWRYEEFYKVLIHELIHFLEIDIQYIIDANQIKSYLMQIFNIDGVCSPSEIYTESLAIIFHSIYICSKAHNFSLINTILENEIKFSLLQSKKILNHIYTDIDNLSISQQTDVLSYFFIKTAVILNLNEFILFLQEDFDFNRRTQEFIELIKVFKEKLNILTEMNLDSIYSKIKSKKELDIIKKTLRMSCLQIE